MAPRPAALPIHVQIFAFAINSLRQWELPARGAVTAPTARRGLASPQGEASDAKCEIEADLTGEGERLQRDGMMRPTHKELGADADTKRGVTACSDIAAVQRAMRKRRGRRIHGPSHDTARPDPDIEPDPRDSA